MNRLLTVCLLSLALTPPSHAEVLEDLVELIKWASKVERKSPCTQQIVRAAHKAMQGRQVAGEVELQELYARLQSEQPAEVLTNNMVAGIADDSKPANQSFLASRVKPFLKPEDGAMAFRFSGEEEIKATLEQIHKLAKTGPGSTDTAAVRTSALGMTAIVGGGVGSFLAAYSAKYTVILGGRVTESPLLVGALASIGAGALIYTSARMFLIRPEDEGWKWFSAKASAPLDLGSAAFYSVNVGGRNLDLIYVQTKDTAGELTPQLWVMLRKE